MKKFTYLLIPLILLPQVALASWWNPLSWFVKKSLPTSTETVSTSTPTISNQTKEAGNISKTKPVIKVVSPSQPSTQIPKLSTSTSSPQASFLSISNVKVGTGRTSARVDWRTNIPTESKVFLSFDEGPSKVFISPAGLSTIHYVEIAGLVSGRAYDYEIIAINNSNAVSYKNRLETERPTKITTLDVKTASLNGPLVIILKQEDGTFADSRAITLLTNYNDGKDFAPQELVTSSSGEVTLKKTYPIQKDIHIIVRSEGEEIVKKFDLKQVGKDVLVVPH